MMISGQRKSVQNELAKKSAIRSRLFCCLRGWKVAEREIHRGIGMNQSGIECRKRRVALIEQHADLGAAQDEAVRAFRGQPAGDIDIGLPRGLADTSD